jgi:hypothetical protein
MDNSHTTYRAIDIIVPILGGWGIHVHLVLKEIVVRENIPQGPHRHTESFEATACSSTGSSAP